MHALRLVEHIADKVQVRGLVAPDRLLRGQRGVRRLAGWGVHLLHAVQTTINDKIRTLCIQAFCSSLDRQRHFGSESIIFSRKIDDDNSGNMETCLGRVEICGRRDVGNRRPHF